MPPFATMFNTYFKPTPAVSAQSAVLQLPGGSRRIVVPVVGPTLSGLFEAACIEAGARSGSVRLSVDGRELTPNAAVATLANLSVVIVEASEFQSSPAVTMGVGGAGAVTIASLTSSGVGVGGHGYDDADPCAICLEAFAASAPAVRAGSTCPHAFHEPCLTEWRTRSAFCPLCRARMGSAELGLPTTTPNPNHYEGPSCQPQVAYANAAGGVVAATAAIALAPSATDFTAMLEATRLRVRSNPEWQRLVAALKSPQAAAMASAAGSVALIAAGGAMRSALASAPMLSFFAGTAANMALAAVSTVAMSANAGAGGVGVAPHAVQAGVLAPLAGASILGNTGAALAGSALRSGAGGALASAAATVAASVATNVARTLPPQMIVNLALQGMARGVGVGSAGAALASMALATGAGGFIASELMSGGGDPSVRICPNHNCRERLRVPMGNSPSFQCGACGRIVQR